MYRVEQTSAGFAVYLILEQQRCVEILEVVWPA